MSRERVCSNCGHLGDDHYDSPGVACAREGCDCLRFALGPVRIDCPCGCGTHSVARKNGHVRGCPCPKCRGGRNRQKGLKKQRKARKALGVPDARNARALSDEELWRHALFCCEVKSGKQVGPAATAIRRAEKQIEQNRAVGDTRRPLVVLMPEGMSDGYVVVRLSDWETHVAPAIEEFTGGGA